MMGLIGMLNPNGVICAAEGPVVLILILEKLGSDIGRALVLLV